MSNSQASISDDLLFIYSTLRRLCYLRGTNRAKPTGSQIDIALFPKRYILKLLDERLEDLTNFAREICQDLFRQIGGRPKRVDSRQLEELDHNDHRGHAESEFVRYPEFDEYFHCCVHHLHDFLIDLHWHEAEIDTLTKADSEYVAKSLWSINEFFRFKKSLIEGGTKPSKDSKLNGIFSSPKFGQKQRGEKLKSNLTSPRKSPVARSKSPTLRRRVRFEVTSPSNENVTLDQIQQSQMNAQNLAEVHSILALDLLIFAVDIFVQQLKARFRSWSTPVEANLGNMLDSLFSSRERIRAKQMQLVAKRVKIHADVHLTVLDYLNEIKTTYLIDKTLEVICARDASRVLEVFKRPKVTLYIQRSLEFEQRILTSLIEQCLQIFFGLLVCEINYPPVELNGASPQRSRDETNQNHANILNFIAGWLQVDDVLFGYGRPRPVKEQCVRTQVEKIASRIQRPMIATTSSTLSVESAYASSSRILAQMDNLCEFLRVFISSSCVRLRHKQHTTYFLDSIATGLLEFFKIISERLKNQLTLCRQRNSSPSVAKGVQSNSNLNEHSGFESSINSMAAKIRCLKVIHITSAAEKVVRAEAKKAKVELASLDRLVSELDIFTEICVDMRKPTKGMPEKSINTKQVDK